MSCEYLESYCKETLLDLEIRMYMPVKGQFYFRFYISGKEKIPFLHVRMYQATRLRIRYGKQIIFERQLRTVNDVFIQVQISNV